MRSRADGFTIVELLVSTALLLTVTGAIFTLLADTVRRSPAWNDAADVQQRGRILLDAIAAELRGAGAGGPLGPLRHYFAVVEPRRRNGVVRADAITVRSVPDLAPFAKTADAVPPGVASVAIVIHAGCRTDATACGFAEGMPVVLFDRLGRWDTATVTGVAGNRVTLDAGLTARAPYAAATDIAEIAETTFHFDARDGVVRREEPGHGDFPLVDAVEALRFEYYDTAARLPLETFADGPTCGGGATAYDCDVLRIRRVRITARLGRRGGAPLTVSLDVAPRNLGL